MDSCFECMPCLGRNAVDVATRATDDFELRKRIIAESFQMLSAGNYDMPPPFYAGKIFEIAGKYCDVAGLYAAEKAKSNQLAEKLLEKVVTVPGYDPASFESRLRLAVAGNILDFGIYHDLDLMQAMESICQTLTAPLDTVAVKRIEKRIESAEKILYLLDNCGEAVFDRVFMAPFRHKVVLGVRGQEVFNDVSLSDLAGCKLENFARKAVSNGTSVPGTVTDLCSEEFMKEFNSADLIIAKGQGNFETLNMSDAPVAFLFMAKCPVVAGLIGAELRSIQLKTVNF